MSKALNEGYKVFLRKLEVFGIEEKDLTINTLPVPTFPLPVRFQDVIIISMQTDSLFYQVFREDPKSLFELLRLDIEGEYDFESISVKTTEKRPYGYFRRTDGEGPNIFLEVQGYDDPEIYWRLFREICTYYEHPGSKIPFVAIVLFLDKKYEPEECWLSCVHPCRFVRCYLPDCLKALGDKASVLTVLKPLVLAEKKKLPEFVPKWTAEIESLKLPEYKAKTLIELLENAILSRFPKLTYEEVRKMIRLTPLEETVAVKQLLQMNTDRVMKEGLKIGEKIGEKKWRQRGELIGKIHLAQRLLKRLLTPKKELGEQSLKALRAILKQLEAELNI